MNADKSYYKDSKGLFLGIPYRRLRLPVQSPACYSPSRNTIYINPPTFDVLSQRAQDFVMCHEHGHATSVDESEADYNGFKQFLRLGYTPKDAIEAMNESLSMDVDHHQERFLKLIYRAALYDASVNGNTLILQKIMNNPNFEQFTDQDAKLLALRAGVPEDEAANFLGISEARQAKKDAKAAKKAEKAAAKQAKKDQKAANKQAKLDAKLAKQEARTNVIQSRANKNNAKAEGIANGTWDGGGSVVKDVFSNIADTAKGILGGGGSEESYEDVYDDEGNYLGSTETKSTSNGMMKWILIGAAVLIAIVVVIIILKKKKK